MPGVKGGHIAELRKRIRKRIAETIKKEPHLTNKTLALRFGVSTYIVGSVRKQMKLEAPNSEFITSKEHRACEAGKPKLTYKQSHEVRYPKKKQ